MSRDPSNPPSASNSAKPPAASNPAAARPAGAAGTRQFGTTGSGSKAAASRDTPVRRPAQQSKPAEPDEELDESVYNSYGGYYSDDDPYGSFDANPFAPPQSGSAQSSSRRSGSRNDAASRSLAGIGLLIQGWATVAIFLIVVGVLGLAFLTASMVGPGGTGTPPPRTFLAMFGLAGIGVFVAAITILVGECICLAIPQKSGAKGLIVASVSMLLVQVVIGVLQALLAPYNSGSPFAPLPMRQGATAATVLIPLIGLFAGLGHMICFELFLRRAALYMRRDDLAKQASIVLFGLPGGFILVIVCALITPFVAVLLGPVFGLLMLIPTIGGAIAMLVFAVMHVGLLFRVGSALRS